MRLEGICRRRREGHDIEYLIPASGRAHRGNAGQRKKIQFGLDASTLPWQNEQDITRNIESIPSVNHDELWHGRDQAFMDMSSRLLEVKDWPAMAQAAEYRCEKLAAKCLMSERQLERFFITEFKQTPKQWMQALRMQRARCFIARGYSTKAAANELFYKGPGQFCREFKKYHGQPPQSYAPKPNVGFGE